MWIWGYSVTTCIYVSVYPWNHFVTLYLHIHLVRHPLNNRHWIHYDMHLKQHIKHIVCLFVVLKAPEGRTANKRDNYESAVPAFSRIQLQSNRVFCSYSVWTFYFTNEMHLVLFPGQSLTLSRSYGHFFIYCTSQLFLIYRHDIFFSPEGARIFCEGSDNIWKCPRTIGRCTEDVLKSSVKHKLIK